MSEVETMERPQSAAPEAGRPGFTIERDVLLDAIRRVGQVVETRNTIPILSNVMLTARDGRLEIVSTDLDILAEAEVACATTGEVWTTVPADLLQRAIDTLQPGTLSVVLKQGEVKISRGAATRKLFTLSPADFPRLQWESGATRFEMNASKLLGMLEAVQAAMSTEEARYYLNGVFVHCTGEDGLTAAATDGYRLHQATVARPIAANGMPDIILGRKTVRLLIRALSDAEDGAAVELHIGDKRAAFRVGGMRIVANLIEATYPDYRRTIPSASTHVLKVQAGELRRCVGAVTALTSGRTRGVRLELRRDGSEAIGQSPEAGRAVEPMSAEFSAPEMIVGANSAYIASICAMFGDAADLEVAFDDPRAPILFTCSDRPGLTAVLMPMNA